MSVEYPGSKTDWMKPHPNRPIALRRTTTETLFNSTYSPGDIIWVNEFDAKSMAFPGQPDHIPCYWEYAIVKTCRKPK